MALSSSRSEAFAVLDATCNASKKPSKIGTVLGETMKGIIQARFDTGMADHQRDVEAKAMITPPCLLRQPYCASSHRELTQVRPEKPTVGFESHNLEVR